VSFCIFSCFLLFFCFAFAPCSFDLVLFTLYRSSLCVAANYDGVSSFALRYCCLFWFIALTLCCYLLWSFALCSHYLLWSFVLHCCYLSWSFTLHCYCLL
jgi:hypothetical protein